MPLAVAWVVLAGFVAMVSLFLVTDTEGYVGRTPPGTLLLDLSSTTGFDAFETLIARAQLAQVSWVVALATACLILCVTTGYARLAAVMPVALGFAIALSLLPRSMYDAVTLDRGALALVCAPEEPRVCARRMHPLVVDDLREPGHQALALLSAKLPQAPTTVVESYYGNDAPGPQMEPRADTVYAEVVPDGSGRVDMTESEFCGPC